jgi:hypothetical protein
MNAVVRGAGLAIPGVKASILAGLSYNKDAWHLHQNPVNVIRNASVGFCGEDGLYEVGKLPAAA